MNILNAPSLRLSVVAVVLVLAGIGAGAGTAERRTASVC